MGVPVEILGIDSKDMTVLSRERMELQTVGDAEQHGATSHRQRVQVDAGEQLRLLPARRMFALSRASVLHGLRMPRVLWRGDLSTDPRPSLWLQGGNQLRSSACGPASVVRLHSGETRRWGNVVASSSMPEKEKGVSALPGQLVVELRALQDDGLAPTWLGLLRRLALPPSPRRGAVSVIVESPCSMEVRDGRGGARFFVSHAPCGTAPPWWFHALAHLCVWLRGGVLRFMGSHAFHAAPCPRGSYCWSTGA